MSQGGRSPHGTEQVAAVDTGAGSHGAPLQSCVARALESSSYFQLPCPVWPNNLPGHEERPQAGGRRGETGNCLHPQGQGNLGDRGVLAHGAVCICLGDNSLTSCTTGCWSRSMGFFDLNDSDCCPSECTGPHHPQPQRVLC